MKVNAVILSDAKTPELKTLSTVGFYERNRLTVDQARNYLQLSYLVKAQESVF